MQHGKTPAVQAGTILQPPFSTQGAKIVDANGQIVLLRGVNWFGFETDSHIVHGLDRRDYKDMLSQIKNAGYNVIRLPYSIQSLRSSRFSMVNFNLGNNADFSGKTPLEAMALIMKGAADQGLLVILDAHGLADNSIPELWYGNGYSEQDWINTWTMLATRYQNQWNVIGADLKNEPHGAASWGDGNLSTDWRLAAQRAGNAIQQIAPQWLILVEGVERTPDQQIYHWWGGNLERAGRYPVQLSVPNKVVYSPHEYGPGVYSQPWFYDPSFPNNMSTRWEIGFNYLVTNNIAPVLVGEFGGRQADTVSKEGIWQRAFVDFIGQKNLSFTYWTWNPDSNDTGGILNDDWLTIHADKQALLNTVLSGVYSGPPSSTGSLPAPTGSTSTSSNTSSTGSVSVQPIISSDWNAGFCLNFKITNNTNRDLVNWKLAFSMNNATLSGGWNGAFQANGGAYTVTLPDWARTLKMGGVMDSIGYCGNKTASTNYLPSNFVLIASDGTVIGSTSTSGSTGSTTPPPPTASSSTPATLTVKTTIISVWDTGFCAEFKVTNSGSTQVRNWRLSFVPGSSQSQMTGTWNGAFVLNNGTYTVTPPDWALVIDPGQSKDPMGFCAVKNGTDYQPSRVTVTTL